MRALLALLAFATCAVPATRTVPDGPTSTLKLNGTDVEVVWTDGDTFVFAEGLRRGLRARLMGVNTLETYGPVHQWGRWSREELLEIALDSAAIAAEAPGSCRATGARDKYRRLLVDCAGARAELLRTGYGHLYPFDREADPEDIALQRVARAEGVGMWAKGVPTEIVTKVDAATEENGWSSANWLVSTEDGRSRRVAHRDEHRICDEVCVGRPPAVPSCLVWVPWERRYEDRPACLE